jgi:hypothetical protein
VCIEGFNKSWWFEPGYENHVAGMLHAWNERTCTTSPTTQPTERNKRSMQTQIQPEKPDASAEEDAFEITRHWNNMFNRWPCSLCGGWTEKQDRHYQIEDEIICDRCGEAPDQIPARVREYASRLRRNASHLDKLAACRYVRNPAGDDSSEEYPYGDQKWEVENVETWTKHQLKGTTHE